MLFADICMHASGTVNLSNYQSVSSRMACRNGVKTVDEEFLYIILKADQLGLCQNLPELNNAPRDSGGGTTEAYISVVRP